MGRRLKSKGCCDCAGGLPCALVCQVAQGTAALCGFDTYLPTSPPAKYRRRTVGGTMAVCTTNDPYCQQPPSCPRSVDLAFSGTIPGAPGTFTGTGHAVDNGNGYYTGSATALYGGSPIGARVSVTVGSFTTHLDATPRGVAIGKGQAVLEINYVTWTAVAAVCITVINAPIIFSIKDTWSSVGNYDAATCALTQTDTTNRQTISGACDGSGSPTPHTFLTPASEYGSGITQAITPTQIVSGGRGCLPLPNLTGQSDVGTVTEALSIEDTPDDAIARAVVEWGFGDCQTIYAFLTAIDPGTFSFGWRKVQVKATIGTPGNPLMIGHSYAVRIGFWRKAIGSPGPYLFFGFQELGVIADAAMDTTPWIDIPNEVGYQTAALTCAYHDTTP